MKIVSQCAVFLLLMARGHILSQPVESPHRRIVPTISVLEYIPEPKLGTINCNAGTEIYMDDRSAFWVNAGYITTVMNPAGYFAVASERTTGFRVQVETRRYLNRHSVCEPAMLLFWPHILQYHTEVLQNSGFYFSPHCSFQLTNTTRTADRSYFQLAGTGEQTYHVYRKVFVLAAVIGYQCVKAGGFTVDYSVGLGAQMIESQSDPIVPPTDGAHETNDLPWKKPFDRGAGIFPKFLYNLRLGWAL